MSMSINLFRKIKIPVSCKIIEKMTMATTTTLMKDILIFQSARRQVDLDVYFYTLIPDTSI